MVQGSQQDLFGDLTVARQNWSVEVRTVDVFVDCAFTAILAIIAMTGNDLAQWTLTLA